MTNRTEDSCFHMKCSKLKHVNSKKYREITFLLKASIVTIETVSRLAPTRTGGLLTIYFYY